MSEETRIVLDVTRLGATSSNVQIVADEKRRRRDTFWSIFGVRRFERAPHECDHPEGLGELLGSATFIVGRGCGHCGWMDGWS